MHGTTIIRSANHVVCKRTYWKRLPHLKALLHLKICRKFLSKVTFRQFWFCRCKHAAANFRKVCAMLRKTLVAVCRHVYVLYVSDEYTDGVNLCVLNSCTRWWKNCLVRIDRPIVTEQSLVKQSWTMTIRDTSLCCFCAANSFRKETFGRFIAI